MQRAGLVFASVALAAVCVARSSGAVEIEPRWRSGGPEGGRVLDLAFSPSDPDRVYAVAGSSTVYRVFASTDAGASWQATTSMGVFPACWAIAVDPLRADRLYAGFSNQGVFRSEDGGRTWTAARTGLPDAAPWWWGYHPIRSLSASRERPGTVLAVVSHPAPGQPSAYLSTDYGATWINTLDADAGTTVVHSLGSPETAYTGRWRSHDGGHSWELVPGLQGVSVWATAFDPTEADHIWAAASGVHRSTDRGETWSLHVEGLAEPWNPGHTPDVVSLAVEWGGASRLVAASRSATFTSSDGGVTWTVLPDPLAPPGGAWQGFPQVRASPQPGGPILGGSARLGLVRLEGSTWTPTNSRLYGVSVEILAVDNQRPWIAYAAAGPRFTSIPGLHRTTDGGETWHEVTGDLGPYSVYSLAVDPSDGQHVLASTGPDGDLVATTDGGETWVDAGLPGHEPSAFGPILFAPSDPLRVFAFDSGTLYRSTDGGWTWNAIALTAHIEPRAAAVDPTNSEVLYAGFGVVEGSPWPRGDALAKSTDGGLTWKNSGTGLPWSPNPCDPVSCPDPVEVIAVDPNHPDRVVAVTQSWGLYVSENGAASWQASTAPALVGGVTFVRDRPDTILVGDQNGGGVLISEDTGATWHPLGAGLDPAPPVLDLASSPDGSLVFAGTSTSVLHLRRSTPPRQPRGRLGAPPP